MRILVKTYVRLFMAVTLLLTGAAVAEPEAATAKPENTEWYKRIYTEINDKVLFDLAADLLKQDGFEIEYMSYGRYGKAITKWSDIITSEDLQPGWEERRQYIALFRRHASESNKYLFILDIIIEQRPSSSAPWQNKDPDYYNDMKYRDMLKRMDEAVIKAGGKVSMVES